MGDQRDESGTSVGNGDSGGGDSNCRSSFVGPTRLSLLTRSFMYHGHTTAMTCAKFLPSRTYVASGDAHGQLRIWSYNHDKHLPRLDVQVLAGLVKDVDWCASRMV
jgi:hypothetical protein